MNDTRRLPPEKLEQIREWYLRGEKYLVIANYLRISPMTVNRYVHYLRLPMRNRKVR